MPSNVAAHQFKHGFWFHRACFRLKAKPERCKSPDASCGTTSNFQKWFFTHFCSKQFWVNFLLYQGLGLSKKAPPPTGMVELLCDQIETTMGHCDLFQRLKKDSYPLEVNAHYSPSPEATESCTLSLSVRDQIGSCFKPTPLVLWVQWAVKYSKTHQKSPMHKILQIVGNILKKFRKVNTEFYP